MNRVPGPQLTVAKLIELLRLEHPDALVHLDDGGDDNLLAIKVRDFTDRARGPDVPRIIIESESGYPCTSRWGRAALPSGSTGEP